MSNRQSWHRDHYQEEDEDMGFFRKGKQNRGGREPKKQTTRDWLEENDVAKPTSKPRKTTPRAQQPKQKYSSSNRVLELAEEIFGSRRYYCVGGKPTQEKKENEVRAKRTK